MGDFWTSISKWFSEKTSSTMYFSYTVFFITWNWQFFQIVFFEDSSLFLTPRVEYIFERLVFAVPSLSAVADWVNTLIFWFINVSWHVLPPAILTLLAILILPHVNRWVLKIELEHRFNRKKDFIVERRKHEQWELQEEQAREERLRQLFESKQHQGNLRYELSKATAKDNILSSKGLTESQIQAILSLLQSFGADTETINNVEKALRR